MTRNCRFTAAWLMAGILLSQSIAGTSYYVDSQADDDSQTGTSPETAWKTLKRASGCKLEAGDRILLKCGGTYAGSLHVQATGSSAEPAVIESYGEGALPLIDARGHLAGIHITHTQHLLIREIAITGDGGQTNEKRALRRRYGVFIDGTASAVSHVKLDGLRIFDIYPHQGSKHEGYKSTTHIGIGIAIRGKETPVTQVVVANCHIERTGFKAIEMGRAEELMLLDNYMRDIGGPALQPGRVKNLLVRGNTVNGSGSRLDPRMHGRGSGIWPWTCENVLIEKNRFMHARGKGDSCGVHIDYNCRNVVVQYNLSYDNEGGFVEILGNNHNCAYRYNISINDGFRVKGIDSAFQEGKILWTSGFVGQKIKKQGPYNSYIYNNTIYVKPGGRSCYSFSPTTEGLLIANNLFYLQGESLDVLGDQDKRSLKTIGMIPRTLVTHNLFRPSGGIPNGIPFESIDQINGDPDYVGRGEAIPELYIPRNTSLVANQGIEIHPLGGDEIGLTIGLKVSHDFFGNPIQGKPDIGAVEIE
jgi:hypothetical protein